MSATPAPAAANTSTTDDALGYDAYAKTLWARIEQALNRDAVTGKQLGDDPLVVGIFGEWGAGKSFLLGRILKHAFAFEQGRIDQRKGGMLGNAGFGLTIPVLFQPWKYEHEEHLHVPLLLHILEALKRDLAASRPIAERAKDGFDKGGDWLKQQMKPAVEAFEKLLAATAVATAPATAGASLSAIPLMGVAKWLLSKLPSKTPDKPNLPATIRYSDEGRYFYEIHQHLKSVTRPATEENHEKGFTQGQQSKHEKLAINFVVFVDDLDRCLPEKAVAVLELIKTVFNVESFAFVLALDDEVIERGIGHRYKDYSFGNKKSEMPITGFEYLEKIVHLPFRLPALTRDDALLFIKQKELKLRDSMTPEQRVAYGNALWFSGHEVPRMSSNGEEATQVLNLSHMLVNSFDAYVPRKLDRAVELFHHVAHVATERGRPIGVSKGAGDIRIVLALVLIQLFQPELFRCFRRTGTGFDQLRDAFKDERLSSLASDYELLDWACYGPERRADTAAVEKLKDKVTESITGVPTEQTERGALNHSAIQNRVALLPTSLSATTKIIANLEASRRHSSQRVRLPIVERLLEHRAAQRHVFDVLKLFAALQASSAVLPLSDESVKPYFSWLALNLSTNTSATLPIVEPAIATEPASADGTFPKEKPPTQWARPESIASAIFGQRTSVATDASRVRLAEVANVFSALTSLEPREQAEVVNRAGLLAGQIMASASAADLLERSKRWLIEREPNTSASGANLKTVLLRGLQYLAPHLAPEDAASFWALVQDAVKLPELPNELVADPPTAAIYADVRAALGQDNRFDPERPYSMKERFTGHSEEDEPIPGFVRIPKGMFTMGHHLQPNNLPRDVLIDKPFYISRTLTTVAQYARFINEKGYGKEGEKFWDKQGLEWLIGNYASEINELWLPERLASRQPELRRVPSNWLAQLAHPCRPVTDVTWFEARAYARWLNHQMSVGLKSTFGSENYEVMLPTEAQWERAARAETLTRSHAHRWPWGDDEMVAAQHANTISAGIGHLSTVGVFAPNAIGLYDMAGNAWQWTDSLYANPSGSDFPHVAPNRDLAMHTDDDKCERPVNRGGGSGNPPASAGCSVRGGMLAGNWYNNVGVRVVLSQRKSEA